MFKKTISIFIITILAFTLSACIAQRNSTSSSAENSSNKTESDPIEAQSKSENKTQVSEPERKEQNTAFRNEDKVSTENPSENKIENRCGWYENPTPGNHWLTDKDGEWTLGTQGGNQADGDYPPEFSDAQWIRTNGNYGYGCACLRVQVNKKEMQITKVVSATARPLSACRNDKALKEPSE
jgi:flagellum-specific peptidoglycan hydrolase FlgJ